MNKDKISAQDVIDSLAAKTDLTKLQAEEFFKAFTATIEEALLANDFVKVKNFGTFKLNWVAPRKSVNIQTGEDIEIDGHYKVVFTPEKNLKELINKPFAHLESVVLDDEKIDEKPEDEINPMASLAEQAGEIKGLLSEIQSMSPEKEEGKQEEKEQEEITAEEIIRQLDAMEQTFVPKEKSEDEKQIIAEKVKIEITEQVSVPQENNHNINVIEKTEVMKENETKTTEIYFEPERKRRTGLWILLAVLLLLGIAVACYFLCSPVQNWVNKTIFGHETVVYEAVEEEIVFVEEVPDEFSRVFDSRFDNREILTRVRVNYGSRLAFLAQRHYGSPHFWVYIYEANREIISNPNFVLIGTIVDIPRMNPMLIDPNNPRSIEAALKLSEQYLR